MAIICFDDLEKAKVLAALYNAAKPWGKDISLYDPNPMTVKEAKVISFGRDNFDYIKGRVLLVIFKGNTFNSKLYNKNNGDGAAEKVIEFLKETDDVNNPVIAEMHRKNVDRAMKEIKKKY